MSSPTAQTWRP